MLVRPSSTRARALLVSSLAPPALTLSPCSLAHALSSLALPLDRFARALSLPARSAHALSSLTPYPRSLPHPPCSLRSRPLLALAPPRTLRSHLRVLQTDPTLVEDFRDEPFVLTFATPPEQPSCTDCTHTPAPPVIPLKFAQKIEVECAVSSLYSDVSQSAFLELHGNGGSCFAS